MSKQEKSTLWNNDMVNAALKAMTPQERERYKKLGENLYKDLDFTTSKVESYANIPPFMYDSAAYISEQIKSGLHPSMLEENEKKLMEEVYGKEWYKKWGYQVEDLDEIVNVLENKET